MLVNRATISKRLPDPSQFCTRIETPYVITYGIEILSPITKTSFIWFITHIHCFKIAVMSQEKMEYDDVIKWKLFPRYWSFVRGIHRSRVNSPHKRQWCGALMFSFICAWIKGWINNRKAGYLRRHRAHYNVIVMNNSLLVGNPITCQSGKHY